MDPLSWIETFLDRVLGSTILDRISWIVYLGSNILDCVSSIDYLGSNILDRVSWIMYFGSAILDRISWIVYFRSNILDRLFWIVYFDLVSSISDQSSWIGSCCLDRLFSRISIIVWIERTKSR